jgi:hypothetical protein
MTRAEAQRYSDELVALGLAVSLGFGGRRYGYTVFVRVDGQDAAKLHTTDDADKLIAGLKKQAQPRESIHGH